MSAVTKVAGALELVNCHRQCTCTDTAQTRIVLREMKGYKNRNRVRNGLLYNLS